MPRAFRPGRTVLDCSGPIHRAWIERLVADDRQKVFVYRPDFQPADLDRLPQHADLHLASGNLVDVLARTRESVSLLLDDSGALHGSVEPLELLRRYYDALAWDGEAWIRFPKSFWVFLEDQHRVSLQDFLVMKFPSVAKKMTPAELDPRLAPHVSSAEGWVRLKKDRGLAKIVFHLHQRSAHATYLEFVEGKRAA